MGINRHKLTKYFVFVLGSGAIRETGNISWLLSGQEKPLQMSYVVTLIEVYSNNVAMKVFRHSDIAKVAQLVTLLKPCLHLVFKLFWKPVP